MSTDGSPAHGASQRTWNDQEQIAQHRRMSIEQRVLRAIELSRAALRISTAKPVRRDGS